MNEREVSHAAWEVFFALGHSGPLRMGNFGEECFLGHVSAGDSANYPRRVQRPRGHPGRASRRAFHGLRGQGLEGGRALVLRHRLLPGGLRHGQDAGPTGAGGEAGIPDEARRGHDFCIEVQARLAERMVPGAIPSELYADIMDLSRGRGMARGFMSLGPQQGQFPGPRHRPGGGRVSGHRGQDGYPLGRGHGLRPGAQVRDRGPGHGEAWRTPSRSRPRARNASPATISASSASNSFASRRMGFRPFDAQAATLWGGRLFFGVWRGRGARA